MEPPSCLATSGGSCLKSSFEAGTIYPDCSQNATLYEGLRQIDEELAAKVRSRGCGRCGGPLDKAEWQRKPRGYDIPDKAAVRMGLCCRRCRCRTLPPSALFLGRKVYLGAVVLISIVVRQRHVGGSSAAELKRLFGVSRETLRRWLSFFRLELPASPPWKVLRGRLSAAVRDDTLPDSFLAELERTRDPGIPAVTACLRLLATAALQAS